MKHPNIYCEPFCIQDGFDFEIHHVRYLDHDTYSCFTHFHQVHEFIFFERIEGIYHYHRGESQLSDFDAVFTPSMETHDFTLSARPKSWYIVQFIPELFSDKMQTQFFEKFRSGSHLSFTRDVQRTIHQLLPIILNQFEQHPQSQSCKQLLVSLFSLVFENSISNISDNQEHLSASASFTKLNPIIDGFKDSSVDYLSLSEAAKLCNLSPSYFSRLFKKHFRMPYTDYITQHKLYCAARILSQTDTPITTIAYDLHFSSPSYFIRQFKSQFRLTPFQYRQQLH
jgi:AraC-like DNA-binding protein